MTDYVFDMAKVWVLVEHPFAGDERPDGYAWARYRGLPATPPTSPMRLD